MTCRHAETTTIAWLYGEADEAHAAHVAGCAACAEIADLHVDVLSAVAPALPALASPPPARRSVVRSPWAWLAAAALLLTPLLLPEPAPPLPPPGDREPELLDLQLEQLRDDLLDLSLDLEAL